MKKVIRTALIGTGNAANMHAQALFNIEETQLTAVCGSSDEKATQFAVKYKLNAYCNVYEMVTKEKIDVVIDCSPHPKHKDLSIAALNAGAHVLVEKPLASSPEDCDKIILAAENNNKKLGVVSQRRFFPSCMRIKKAIEDGKIGTPMLGVVTMLGWRDQAYYESAPWRGTWAGEGGGVLINQAPHQLDLLLWYMGGEPQEVYGVWTNINHPYIEVDDTAVAIIKFKNGAIANVLVSNAQRPGIYGKVHIHGSNGASVGVETDSGAMFVPGVSNIKAAAKNDIWTIPQEEDLPASWEKEDAAFFSSINPIEYFIGLQDRDFILAVLNNNEPFVTANEGKKTVEIFSAIYRSMQENNAVHW